MSNQQQSQHQPNDYSAYQNSTTTRKSQGAQTRIPLAGACQTRDAGAGETPRCFAREAAGSGA